MPNRVLGGIFLTIAASICSCKISSGYNTANTVSMVSLFSSLCGIINGCNL